VCACACARVRVSVCDCAGVCVAVCVYINVPASATALCVCRPSNGNGSTLGSTTHLGTSHALRDVMICYDSLPYLPLLYVPPPQREQADGRCRRVARAWAAP
jgi:hypothetical protein